MRESKKQKAFSLFDQGVTPENSLVIVLLPNTRTRRRYYREWQRAQAKAAAPEAAVVEAVPVLGVAVVSLPLGTRFEYEGQLYNRGPSMRGKIIGIRLVRAQFSATFFQQGSISLDPNTLVIKV